MKYASHLVQWLIIGILLLSISGSVMGSSAWPVEQVGTRIFAGEGYMDIGGPLPFMHLKGSPYEMGLQHGTLLAQLHREDTLVNMADQLNPLNAPASGVARLMQEFQRFYFRYKLEPWILRNIPADLYTELQGIVYGVSGGEDDNPQGIIMGNVAQDLGMTFACTSIVAFGDATASGALYHARNLDQLGMIDWGQYGYVVVYEPDEGYPFITHIYPVHAGTMQAMNNQGITVSVNYSLVDRSANDLDGIGMVFLIREIVQHASTLDQAIGIVLSSPRTFGLNILISDSKIADAVVLEVDANRYAIRRPNGDILYTANRYNSEYMQQFQTPGWLASARRENRLSQFLADNHGEITVESMVDLLRDRNEPSMLGYEGLVDGINNAGTLLSTVFSPDEQMLWVSVLDKERGSPDAEFYAFSLARALAGEEPAVISRNIAPTPEDQNLGNWLLVRQATIAYSRNQLLATLDILEQIDPKYSEAEAVVNLKAHVHFRLGNKPQAQHYFQILADRPQLAEPFYHLEAFGMLGAFHDEAGDRDAALAYYHKALGIPIEDLGRNTTFYWRLAEAGLGQPISINSSSSGYAFSTREGGLVQFFKASKARFVDVGAYNQYDGLEIAHARVLGAHDTDTSVVSKVTKLQPGSKFDAARFQAGKRRLAALGALDQVQMYVVPVNQTHVDVVVRINEGFGLYVDPVDFVMTTLLNLSQRKVALNYYNVGGKLASVGGEYGFAGNDRKAAYLTLPVYTLPTTIRYQSETYGTELVWGEHSGSEYTLARTDFSVSTQALFGYNSAVTLVAGYSKSDVSGLSTTTGLDVPSNEYISLSATIQTGVPGNTTWTLGGTTVQAGAAVLANRFDLREFYPRVEVKVRNSTYLGGGFVSRLELVTAWTEGGTPYDRRFRLGGHGQLGASTPRFVGEMYAYANLELERYFTDVLAAHVSFEAARIWENSAKPDLSSRLYSVGGGLTYQTPIGLKVRAQYSRNMSLPNVYSVNMGLAIPF